MASNHDSQIDPNVLIVLPNVDKVLDVSSHGESAWAKGKCIKVRDTEGKEERYFMKISKGHHGLEALKGEFASTSAIYALTPDFCPKPIACGTFQTDPDSHFYVCKFYDFTEGVPQPDFFCERLARLHSKHRSPEGKFGFPCTTYNGDLPQDNTWCDSWETFFSNALRQVLKVREERAGPSEALDALQPALFNKVIPRLLGPLESHGRKIQPSLVHGDLWYGNTGILAEDPGQGIVFDPSSFWAHNEYELGNWRPERNLFTEDHFEEYHKHIDRSEPQDDYNDRIALYSLKFNLHAAALFPTQDEFLQMALEEIRRLVDLYA